MSNGRGYNRNRKSEDKEKVKLALEQLEKSLQQLAIPVENPEQINQNKEESKDIDANEEYKSENNNQAEMIRAIKKMKIYFGFEAGREKLTLKEIKTIHRNKALRKIIDPHEHATWAAGSLYNALYVEDLKQELRKYQEVRSNELGSLKNFFPHFYSLDDYFTKQDKVGAVNKLIEILDNKDVLTEDFISSAELADFSHKELRALGDGRLGKIIVGHCNKCYPLLEELTQKIYEADFLYKLEKYRNLTTTGQEEREAINKVKDILSPKQQEANNISFTKAEIALLSTGNLKKIIDDYENLSKYPLRQQIRTRKEAEPEWQLSVGELKKELKKYQEIRNNEFGSLKSFFPRFYSLDDYFTKQDKVDAVNKLISILDNLNNKNIKILADSISPAELEDFNDKELRALGDGRLGKIIAGHYDKCYPLLEQLTQKIYKADFLYKLEKYSSLTNTAEQEREAIYKLKAVLSPAQQEANNISFTTEEVAALSTGELKKIIGNYEKLSKDYSVSREIKKRKEQEPKSQPEVRIRS